MAGGKKGGFYQRAAYWREDPVLQIYGLTGERISNAWRTPPAKLKWNWPADSTVNVRASTNCDEVELFLNNRSLGRKPVSHNTYFEDWKVPYRPGELRAVGYLKGRRVTASTLITAGDAANLQVAALPLAVAGDVLLFEIIVNDKAGVKVVDAKAAVTIQVAGAGRLIGVDNGELDFAGPYKKHTRNAYDGRLIVTVQRTTAEGEISVTATAPGLTAGTIKAK